jgi:hypothetical protein
VFFLASSSVSGLFYLSFRGVGFSSSVSGMLSDWFRPLFSTGFVSGLELCNFALLLNE